MKTHKLMEFYHYCNVSDQAKVYTTLENPYSNLPHYQAFTFKWVKMFLKILENEVCINLDAF